MKLIPFHDYSAVILKRIFPPIANRRELLNFMGGNSEANLLWTNYLIWHCDLKSVQRSVTFRYWLRHDVKRTDCSYSEWCFVADVVHDRDFPIGSLDCMTEYLLRIGADDSTLDSLESLWIKYNFS